MLYQQIPEQSSVLFSPCSIFELGLFVLSFWLHWRPSKWWSEAPLLYQQLVLFTFHLLHSRLAVSAMSIFFTNAADLQPDPVVFFTVRSPFGGDGHHQFLESF